MNSSDKSSFITVRLSLLSIKADIKHPLIHFNKCLNQIFCYNHLFVDRGNHHEFLSLVKELARPGDITQNTSFDFEFNQVEKPYECYTGANVKLR